MLFCGVSVLSFALWLGVVLGWNYYPQAECGVLGDVVLYILVVLGLHYCPLVTLHSRWSSLHQDSAPLPHQRIHWGQTQSEAHSYIHNPLISTVESWSHPIATDRAARAVTLEPEGCSKRQKFCLYVCISVQGRRVGIHVTQYPFMYIAVTAKKIH